MPRLKTYRTKLGFFESVVAAPNQGAALKAWGVSQNLFAEGLAAVTDDPAASQAALAQPGVPLRRAMGSSGPFVAEDAPLPDVPDGPAHARAARPRKPPPDRRPLDDALDALADLDRRQDREREAMDLRIRQMADERRAAEREVTRARKAYRAAGGKDDED